MTAGFGAVGLPPQHLEARGHGLPSANMPQTPGIAKQVLRAVERDSGAGAEVREHARDLHIRTRIVGFRDEDGPDTVEAHGEISDRCRAPGAIPSQAGHVRLGAGVGVLSGDELKRIDTLRGQGIAESEAVAVKGLVQAGGDVVGVDDLRRVGVEGAFVDVGPVRQLIGVGGQKARNDLAGSGEPVERISPGLNSRKVET